MGLLARVQAVTSGGQRKASGETLCRIGCALCGAHYCLVLRPLNCKMGIAVGLL